MMPRIPYLIVGAGPAGLQMAYFLQRAGHDFLVLESGDRAGSFFEVQPRHRQLLSHNRRFNLFPEEDFNLRHDWNSLLSDDPGLKFGNYSKELFPHADDYTRYLRDFAAPLAGHIHYGSRVDHISRDGVDGFAVRVASGQVYRCQRLLMATGAVAPYLPADIEGIEYAEGYETHSVNPEDYEGQVVAVIGAGNSAFEVANHLAGHAAVVHVLMRHPARHSWQTHFPGDLRAVNDTILDFYMLKSLHATIGLRVEKIEPLPSGGFAVTGSADLPHWDPPGTATPTIPYNRVIRCTGWRYVDPALFAEDCKPELDPLGRFPILSSTWESSVPGLYFIGTSMQVRDHTAASGFIHGFRYNVRTLFHLMNERYHNVPLPAEEFKAGNREEIEALADTLINRVSTAGSLYQQFGVFGDVLIPDGNVIRQHRALPVDYILERFADQDIIVVTMEYGFRNHPTLRSTLDYLTAADPAHPECFALLHAIFRRYSRGELADELHFSESLVIRWDILGDAAHRNKLVNFLARALGSTEPPDTTPLISQEIAFAFKPWTEEQRRSWISTVNPADGECGCKNETQYRRLPAGNVPPGT
jgi:thioredoxin reductase